jgi:hypothetical protein
MKLSQKFLGGAVAGSGFAVAALLISVAYAALNYTVAVNTGSTGSTLASSEWNKMVSNFTAVDAQLTALNAAVGSSSIPSGAVMAFNLASCPTGWSSADGSGGRPDLRGEFIRGLDNGRGVDSGRTLASAQAASSVADFASAQSSLIYVWVKNADGTDGTFTAINGGVGGSSATATYRTMRPRNVALLYCVKN